MLCHATCNIYKFRIIIFPTYNFHSSQLSCQYITQAHMNMIFFTHNHILFIFPTIHTKWSKSRTHINRAPLGLFMTMNHFFGSIHQQITVIPKHTTKPEGISHEIKTKPQHSPGLPENSCENLVRNVREQSQKFSPYY